MKISYADLEIDLLEFSDRHCIIRSTNGCTPKGKIEFDARIEKIGQIIKEVQESTPTKPVGEIYLENQEFQHHCDRALELNGIDPEWLTMAHITALLLVYKQGVGMLVQLNTVNNPGVGDSPSVGGNIYHQLLGGLYSFTQSATEAFKLAEEKPLSEVAGMIKAVAQMDRPFKDISTVRGNNKPKKISDRTYANLMNARSKTNNERSLYI